MSEPMWMTGDAAANTDSAETTAEVQCSDCIWEGTIECDMEVSHDTVHIWADWTCPNPECGAKHTLDKDYEASDYFNRD